MADQHLSGQRLHSLQGSEVFVVDDDESMREALAAVLALEGCRVTCFSEGHLFLQAARAHPPACILHDVNMPDRSGLDMLRELDAPHYPAPIIIVSAQRDVPTAVNAIKGGALDFIEKPFDGAAVVARVRRAIEDSAPRNGGSRLGRFPGSELLTPRESEVLAQVAGGCSNKEAGRHLGISPRTVEVYRARVMDKLGARNTADLVRIVLGNAGP